MNQPKERPVIATLAPPAEDDLKTGRDFVSSQVGRTLQPDRNPEPLPAHLIVHTNEILYKSVAAITWRTLRSIRDAVKNLDEEHRRTWDEVEKAWTAAYDAHEISKK